MTQLRAMIYQGTKISNHRLYHHGRRLQGKNSRVDATKYPPLTREEEAQLMVVLGKLLENNFGEIPSY